MNTAHGLKTNWLIALVVAGAAVVVYVPAFSLGYVGYDDHYYILTNTPIHHLNLDTVKWAFRPHYTASNYHPLTWLSLALDIHLFGHQPPTALHAINVLFHALNSALVALLAWSLFTWPTPRRPQGTLTGLPLWLATTIVGLGFAIHPQHVESICWLPERKDVLCAFFSLLALLAYLDYVRRDFAGRRSWPTYVLVVVLAALALLSKPMAVTLPLVLLILDAYPLGRLRQANLWRIMQLIGEKAILITFVLALCFVTYEAQGNALASLDAYPAHSRAATALTSYATNLQQFFWPVNLSPLYPLRVGASYHWSGPLEAVGVFFQAFYTEVQWPQLTVTALLAVAAVAFRRTMPGLTAALAIYFVTLIPVNGLILQVGLQSVADRYMYLPSIPILIIVGWTAGWICQDRPQAGLAAALRSTIIAGAAVIAVLLCLGTQEQIKVWDNAATLWGAAYHRTYDNPEATFYYAMAENDRGELLEAKEVFKQLLNFNGHGSYKADRVLPALARIYVKLGNFPAAKIVAERSLRSLADDEDRDAAGEMNLIVGRACLHENQLDDAEDYFRKVIKATPNSPEAQYDLACAEARAGRITEALSSLRAALKAGYVTNAPSKSDNLFRDPDLSNVRADSAFAGFLSDMKIKPAASAVND